MKSIATLVAMSLAILANCQSLKKISDLSEQEQMCLDKGVDMMKCSRIFCEQMDTMLNLAYSNLREKLSPKEKEVLKKEQIAWLQKRDKFFKKETDEFQKKYNSGEWGSDMFMLVYEDDAEFIKKRTIVLINRMNSLK